MLNGVWIPQGAEFAGEAVPFPDSRLLIDGDRYVVETAAGREEGTLVVDTSVVPHTIDLRGTSGPHRGQSIPALFRLRGNLLQLCYCVGIGAGIQPRPDSLGAPAGSMQFLIRYRREAGASAAAPD